MAFPELDRDRARTQTQISLTPKLMLLTTRPNYRHLKPRHPRAPVLEGSWDARFLPPSPRSPSETFSLSTDSEEPGGLLFACLRRRRISAPIRIYKQGNILSLRFVFFSCWLHLHMRAGLNPFIHRGNLTSTSLLPFVSHAFTAPPPLYMAHDLSILILQDHSIIFCLEEAARRFSSRVRSVVTPHITSHQNFSNSAQKPPISKSPGELVKSRFWSPTPDHPHYHLQVWGPGIQVLTKSSAKACVLN